MKELLDNAQKNQSKLEEGSARQKLLETAAPLFAELGIDGVSVRDIAKAANLNISLISYYFGGKEGLYRAVISDFAMRAHGEFQRQMASLDSHNLSKELFSQTMHKIISEIVNMKINSPFISKILQREVLSGLPYAKDIHENIFQDLVHQIVGLMKTAQKKGFLKKEINPYVLFISMVHAMDTYFIANPCLINFLDQCPKLPKESQKYADQIFKIFIEGALQ